jgi:hypothetical protein
MTPFEIAVLIKKGFNWAAFEHTGLDFGPVNCTPPASDFTMTLNGERFRVTIQKLRA